LAAKVLNKPPEEVTKAERKGVKAISFGRPGGMGARTLRQVAKNNYGIDLDDAQVGERIQAYHKLCPELDTFLKDEVDVGKAVAEALQLTPAAFYQATGRTFDGSQQNGHEPESWLGLMLLKVLRDRTPRTQQGAGRPYTPEEINFFWEEAQELSGHLQHPHLLLKLAARQADPELSSAVRDPFGRRSVFTLTGRIRANATFCAARNSIFQGGAADGALLGLWLVWRAGYKVVDFVHDQVVVEVPADEQVRQRAGDVERLLVQGMQLVLPDMRIKAETVITKSLNKNDLVPVSA
jgi:hypothetical protein